jgi:hypothetical protein
MRAACYQSRRKDGDDGSDSAIAEGIVHMPQDLRLNGVRLNDVTAVDDIKAFPEQPSDTAPRVAPSESGPKSKLFGCVHIAAAA